MILNKAEENLYNKCSCKAGLLKARQARPHDNELKPRTLQYVSLKFLSFPRLLHFHRSQNGAGTCRSTALHLISYGLFSSFTPHFSFFPPLFPPNFVSVSHTYKVTTIQPHN